MNRRKLIKNGVIAVTGMSAFTGLYTWQIEPFWLEFVHVDMKIDNLPKSLVGKTLMQISDIHVGNRFDYQYLIDSFRKAQKMKPDFVVYTGDYVSYVDAHQHKQLDKVLAHVVHGNLGTVGILGNHDYGHNWSQSSVADRIAQQLSIAGVKVLRNEQLELNGINFIGLDDYWGTNYDPRRVMKQHNNNVANIVFCHNPDVCDQDVWYDYQGWILSGHTHGGQCKPPFLPPPMLPVKNLKYASGKVDLQDGRTLYVNRALGHLWQVRFNVRPEITIFTLV